MIAAQLAMALAAALPRCTPVPGADALWRDGARWIFVGEVHGTNETPDAFANLVCLAPKTRPVIVALEYPESAQAAIDAFILSDGGATARAAFLAAPVWHGQFQDGRTSTAFLRLFERLRVMRREHRIMRVRGFDMPEDGSDHRDRNAAMADRLTHIADESGALVMILVGNLHAVRIKVVRPQYTVTPAAALLPADRVVSVNVIGSGGTAWNCQRECGEHPGWPEHPARMGITWDTAPDRRWDATYELGVPTTAAAPAVPVAPAKP